MSDKWSSMHSRQKVWEQWEMATGSTKAWLHIRHLSRAVNLSRKACWPAGWSCAQLSAGKAAAAAALALDVAVPFFMGDGRRCR